MLTDNEIRNIVNKVMNDKDFKFKEQLDEQYQELKNKLEYKNSLLHQIIDQIDKDIICMYN